MNELFNRLIYWIKYTLIPWYTSLGITKGTITLEVVGRRSGRIIRVSVTMVRHAGASSARLFFGLGPNPRLEEMQAIAHRYPVFRIDEAE
jgi:hypothetical protein